MKYVTGSLSGDKCLLAAGSLRRAAPDPDLCVTRHDMQREIAGRLKASLAVRADGGVL